MYTRKMQNTIFSKPNLHTIAETKLKNSSYIQYNIMVRHMSVSNTLKYVKNMQDKIATVLKKGVIYKTATSIPHNLKEHSSKILRSWVHQCECVVAQRLRRSQQMFSLYSKLWEEQALKEFIKRMRQQFTKHGKEFICGAIGVSTYNWEKNRIPEKEIFKHTREFEYIEKLRHNTIKCNLCDVAPRNSHQICHCPDKTKFKFEEWELFIEKDDLLIWRKIHENGCYEYKVYGSYNDVMTEDFVNVQIDINYRKTWDPSAVVLELIEKDPTPKSNSDLVYWEMQWPRLFTNRDYVFNRRYLVDHGTKTIIIANRITQHPKFPVKSDKFRVEDYWSNMVIKPYTDYNKPGLEFALTYFENSGVNIPATVTSWVAMKAMPEYLTKLREATKQYESFCKKSGQKCVCKFFDKNCSQVSLVRLSDYETMEEPKLLTCNKENPSQQPPSTSTEYHQNAYEKVTPNLCESVTAPTPINQTEYENNYWKYLQPTYYFS